MPKSQHVQQMHSTPAPATRHCAPRKILLGRSGTHPWDTLRCTLSPRCCCSPCTSRTQPLAVERSEPSASQSCPIPPARAPERSPSAWAVAPIPELPRSQLYPSSSLLPRLQLQHQSSPHPSQWGLGSPPPRCRVIRPCCYTLCIRTSVASAMVCCSQSAPLSLLPADGRETLHPALAAGQAHCSSELRSFGAASTPARRGRPGEGDRRQHLLRYGRCPWPGRAAAGAAARAARAAPGKLKLCQ